MGIGCIVALAVLMPLQLLLVSGSGSGEPPLPARAGSVVAAPVTTPTVAPPITVPVTVPNPTPLIEPTSEPAATGAPAESDAVTALASPPDPEPIALTFSERRSAHEEAVQDPSVPATTRWALLIGINEHEGRVADNIGSRQDAEALREHLLAHGWLDDHIMLITDRAATGDAIRDGLRWLAEKTDESSVAIFHYSGHTQRWRHDYNGDGRSPDVGLWPTDDDFIVDAELIWLLDQVQPSAFWISFATCHAGGFGEPGGLAQPGRVITFSSAAWQKSYEHPSWGHSVWGWFMIQQAMRGGLADLDGDGQVSVQEAWAWARPHAAHTTHGQRYGPQEAEMIDELEVAFHVGIPGIEPPPPSPQPATEAPPASQDPQPQQPAQPDPQPEPEADREPERHGGYICLLCGSRR